MRRGEAVHTHYIEAFPRIDFVRADSAWNSARPVCVFVDEKGQNQGCVFLIQRSVDCITVGWSFFGMGGHPAIGVITFETASWGNRLYVSCPDCRKRKAVLVFAGTWACSECFGLCHRSELLTRDVAKQERYENLRQEVKKGRPRRMRMSTWKRRLADLEEARAEAPGEHCAASEAHRSLIKWEWISAREKGALLHPDYEIEDDEIRPVAKKESMRMRGPPIDF